MSPTLETAEHRPARRLCEQLHLTLRMLPILSAFGCTDFRWSISAETALFVQLSETGQLERAEIARPDGAGFFNPPSGSVLVALSLETQDFLTSDGLPLDFGELGVHSPTEIPERSCRRCPTFGAGPPAVLGAGSLCPVPAWVAAVGAWADGEAREADEALVARARAAVLLSRTGECDSPARTLAPLEALGTPFGRVCPLLPLEAPLTFGSLTVRPDGTVVGVASGYVSIIEPGGEVVTLDAPAGKLEAAAVAPGGDVVWPVEEGEDLTHFFRLRVEERRIETLPYALTKASPAQTLANGDVLLFGRTDLIAGFRCPAGGDSCEPIHFPVAGDPSCGFLEDPTGIPYVLELDDHVLLQHKSPMGLLYWRPGERMTCQQVRTRGALQIQELGPMVRFGRTVLMAGWTEPVFRFFLLKAELGTDEILSDLEVIEEIQGPVGTVVKTPGGAAFLTASGVVELDPRGTVVRRDETVRPDPWPGLDRGAARVVTTTSGWQLAEDSLGRLHLRRGEERFRKVYGSETSSLSGINALSSAAAACHAAILGRTFRITHSGPSCADASVEAFPSPEITRQPVAGFPLDGLPVWIVPDELAWKLLVTNSSGDTSTLAELPRNPAELLVAAVALAPTIGLLGFSQGDLIRVDASGATASLKLPGSLLTLTSALGVAWAGGDDWLVRVTPTLDGLTQDSWTERLRALPHDVPLTRRVLSAHALSADNVLLSVMEVSERFGQKEDYGTLLEIRPTPQGPVLGPTTGAVNPEFVFEPGGYIFAGRGSRTTWTRAGALRRPNVPTRILPYGAHALADCGPFMLMGGASEHALTILDP
ncbi:MAG: hypothetical protein HYV07_14380 [Deltaproteobacteria bacterium]|nr:hypothetical protein [Deltaproteobacteria bacterium]